MLVFCYHTRARNRQQAVSLSRFPGGVLEVLWRCGVHKAKPVCYVCGTLTNHNQVNAASLFKVLLKYLHGWSFLHDSGVHWELSRSLQVNYECHRCEARQVTDNMDYTEQVWHNDRNRMCWADSLTSSHWLLLKPPEVCGMCHQVHISSPCLLMVKQEASAWKNTIAGFFEKVWKVGKVQTFITWTSAFTAVLHSWSCVCVWSSCPVPEVWKVVHLISPKVFSFFTCSLHLKAADQK